MTSRTLPHTLVLATCVLLLSSCFSPISEEPLPDSPRTWVDYAGGDSLVFLDTDGTGYVEAIPVMGGSQSCDAPSSDEYTGPVSWVEVPDGVELEIEGATLLVVPDSVPFATVWDTVHLRYCHDEESSLWMEFAWSSEPSAEKWG